jgi:hypothetical protein
MKYKLIIPLLFLILIPLTLAYETGEVLYITRFPTVYEDAMVSSLIDMGFTVDIVTESNLDTISYDDYVFMIVGEDYFADPELMPVNTKKSIILNTWNIDDFHWAVHGSAYASSQPIDVINVDDSHLITNGIGPNPVIYTTAQANGPNIEVNFLSRLKRAPQLKSIVSTVTHTLDSIIATAVPGTSLKDGVTSNTKTAFFGIVNSEYWTDDAETLFENTVIWLLTDDTPPVISNVNADVAETSAEVTWDTDDNANFVFSYGLTDSLGSEVVGNEYSHNHLVLLPSLLAETEYFYQIEACNNDGLCSVSEIFSFTTLDLTDPIILNFNVENVLDTTADLVWETNELTDATVFLGTNALTFAFEFSVADFTLENTLAVANLEDNTEYFVKIETCDKSDNCVESDVKTFTTLDFTNPASVENLIDYVTEPGKVNLQWDEVIDDDEITYNIYASIDHENFNFATPLDSTTETTWVDEDASNYDERYYIVRAVDESGNEETNENIVGKYDIQIKQGRTLISLPLVPFDTFIPSLTYQDAVFKPLTKILRREADGSYTEAVYENDAWTLNGFENLELEVGYYTESNIEYDLTITGALPAVDQTLSLVEGINLIGFNTVKTYDLDLLDHVEILEIFSREGPECFQIAHHYATEFWSATGLDSLEPGKGYFIKTSGAIDITFEGQ